MNSNVVWLGKQINSFSPGKYGDNVKFTIFPKIAIRHTLNCNTRRVRFTFISHTPGRSRFYHIHSVQTELRWRLSIEFDTTKLLIFYIWNLFHCVAESRWNIPFKGTRHGDAVAYVIVASLIRLFSIMTSSGLNTYCDVTQCMNGLWIFITKHELLVRARAIHNHKPHPFETMGRVW